MDLHGERPTGGDLGAVLERHVSWCIVIDDGDGARGWLILAGDLVATIALDAEIVGDGVLEGHERIVMVRELMPWRSPSDKDAAEIRRAGSGHGSTVEPGERRCEDTLPPFPLQTVALEVMHALLHVRARRRLSEL